jgi:uncharacterized protein YndB with AHSA1/START domain
VWKALTDPALIPLWTWTGRGGRSEGFEPEAGNRFRFVAKPFPGWDGIVRCEILTVDEPSLLRYTWRNKDGDRPSIVTNRLDDTPTGTRFTYEHTDFHGLEGLIMSKLLGRIRRRMLTEGSRPPSTPSTTRAGPGQPDSTNPDDGNGLSARWARPPGLTASTSVPQAERSPAQGL